MQREVETPGRAAASIDDPAPLVAAAPPRALGLSAKLLLLTTLFVMLAEVLIFVPSIANYRISWLNDRLSAARLASLAAEGAPGGLLPDPLRMDLLMSAQVRAVAIKRDGSRRVVLPPDQELAIDETIDLRRFDEGGIATAMAARFSTLGDAVGTFFGRRDRIIRVIGQPAGVTGLGPQGFVEIVVPEEPLRVAMVAYSLNILLLSIVISLVTAALVYFALNRLLVQPMMRITRSMLYFSQNPEDASRIIVPSPRTDELGTAERELAHMQGELNLLLHQKSRLAQLGLAVSKINHDLRNMLSSAQLISDRLRPLPDPTVQRFVPKLIASLDRAIAFCNDTLRFGRAEEAAPRFERFALAPLLTEVGDGLAVPRERLDYRLEIDPALEVEADRENLYRVLNNIVRNAVAVLDAMERPERGEIVVGAMASGQGVRITIRDNGPGIPAKLRARLFEPFHASSGRDGAGLGLAIAHEIVAAHGGRLRVAENQGKPGTTFEIVLPGRPALAGAANSGSLR